MGDKGDSGSLEGKENFGPIFFGVSCAFFALRVLPDSESCDENWSEIRNKMLQGSAQLLGLLVWRIQKEEANNTRMSDLTFELENARGEIEELKKQRSEDAKANAKVVGIYAAQEQCWFNERKKLRQQIGGLMHELRVVGMKKDKTVSELNEKLRENEAALQLKDKAIEEEGEKCKELEDELRKAENVAEELRNAAKVEAQKHGTEITKHKTAFIELVSSQRQLEAEMGRAARQFEAAKEELDSVLQQKEQSVLMMQKLSMDLVKVRKDLEQKDQILSAMLRKSKLDTAEKQMLLQEVKLSKSKRKQAELETERWKHLSESRHERLSLRNLLSKHGNSKLDGKGLHPNEIMPSNSGKNRLKKIDYLLEYEQSACRKDPELISPLTDNYLTNDNEISVADIEHLENWVRSEVEKYRIAFEQRHHLEIEAFAEQLRLKDEKLEAFRWRLLSMEVESKRLRSHFEAMDQDLSQLRQENMRLEALVSNREAEINSLNERLSESKDVPDCQKPQDQDTIWSKVKIIKRKPGEKEQGIKKGTEEICEEAEITAVNPPKDIILTLKYPIKEIQEEGASVALQPSSTGDEHFNTDNSRGAETSTSVDNSAPKISPAWKVNLQALGISCKIKMLKQQFLVLERLTGKQERCENSESNGNAHFTMQGFYALISVLNKQVARYESLQGKIDDLCKRMHENNLDKARTKEQIKMLEHFLEETFQLQRYIVATGQKLIEVQTKVGSGLVGALQEVDRPDCFDMKRFADNIKTLFKEVQRGLEVRIARIIGDLEGTLACDGMTR
ncbi:PREDICTED: centromere-associated protein E [Ipomoea nil]|uniref:centromere-associated protein E n=1 Tax=Ipomoea nil TaxID=35883 RepID=UPI000901C9CB|nr:PREDICTED: centromere-associated protein E [Ipomoea nil]XP_019200294.1 PREDICTED: centromere-associated protein E [Ipomoea nil]XP_019200295.1 PREDICTED: centromere-associated protein E [Ipomoea nil]